MHEEVERRVGALPGVLAASYASIAFTGPMWVGPVWVAGYNNNKDVNVSHNFVGAGYFAAMQIPLLAGRAFGPQDTHGSAPVAIISETMARSLFPTGSPIGRRYGLDGPRDRRQP